VRSSTQGASAASSTATCALSAAQQSHRSCFGINLSKYCRDDASRNGDRLSAEQRVATDERIPRLASHWLYGRYSIVRVPFASQVALYRATLSAPSSPSVRSSSQPTRSLLSVVPPPQHLRPRHRRSEEDLRHAARIQDDETRGLRLAGSCSTWCCAIAPPTSDNGSASVNIYTNF